MPDSKISQLNSASTLTGAELVAVVQYGDTDRTTTKEIANLFDLFPNGIENILVDTAINEDMVGKMLFLQRGAKLTMPEGVVMPDNSHFFVYFAESATPASVEIFYGYPPLVGMANEGFIFISKTESEETDFSVNPPVVTPYDSPQTRIVPIGTSLFPSDENSTNLYTTAKHFYQKEIELLETAGKIITLGTITFEDVNDALANTVIELNLANTPENYYIEKFFFNIQNTFDVAINTTSFVVPDLSINQPIDLSTVSKEILNNSPINIELLGTTANKLALNFDVGGGETNPQNLTTGSITIKALIKKFPN